jgi:hypothetical protein
MAAMLATNAMLARASARPVAARRQRAVAAKASAVEKASPSNEAGVTMRARVERVGKTVLSGVVAAGLASAMAPEPALAVSLRDPVFGDIEVWQFIVLTAGYWWGIEFYLDNKYDKPKPGKVMPKVSAAKKAEVGANKTFAEANAAKEAENEQ